MVATHLEEAGVPDGGPEFELWVAEGFLPRAAEVVQAIVAQMEQVGLKPRVVTTDVAGLIDDIFTDGGTGAMYHLSWAASGDPHHAAAVYSSAFAWYFGDEQLQALIDEGVTTLTRRSASRSTATPRPACGSRCGTSRCTTPTSPSPTRLEPDGRAGAAERLPHRLLHGRAGGVAPAR